jgi:ABC-type uncharacterized transport system fused permease/ATPase subunit
LYFILIKLETSLENYFRCIHFNEKVEEQRLNKEYLFIWKSFVFTEDAEKEVISSDQLQVAVMLLSDFLVYLSHWEKEFLQTMSKEEHKNDYHPSELLKLELLQTNLRNCLVHLQIIVVGTFFLFSDYKI